MSVLVWKRTTFLILGPFPVPNGVGQGIADWRPRLTEVAAKHSTKFPAAAEPWMRQLIFSASASQLARLEFAELRALEVEAGCSATAASATYGPDKFSG